jgi:hypothetical protein
VYGFVPRAPIDLLPISSSVQDNFDATQHAEQILTLHRITKENIKRMNAKYKVAGDKGRKHIVFDVGDLVWLHLRKDHFPDLRKSKLMSRVAGPLKVLEKINDNAYKLELPAEMGMVSPSFNIVDLKPYFGEEDEIASRTTSIQEGEDNEGIPTVDTTVAPTSTLPRVPQFQGPLTRARARQLNYHVLSFLGTIPNIYENMMLPKSDVFMLLRNDGPSMDERDKHWSMIIHGDNGSNRVKIQDDAASEDFRTLKPP